MAAQVFLRVRVNDAAIRFKRIRSREIVLFPLIELRRECTRGGPFGLDIIRWKLSESTNLGPPFTVRYQKKDFRPFASTRKPRSVSAAS